MPGARLRSNRQADRTILKRKKPTHNELLLESMAETMRAQREILELLRTLRLEMQRLRIDESGAAIPVRRLPPPCAEPIDHAGGNDGAGAQTPALDAAVTVDASATRLEPTRRRRLHLVANNVRFLVLPWVRVKCLGRAGRKPGCSRLARRSRPHTAAGAGGGPSAAASRS